MDGLSLVFKTVSGTRKWDSEPVGLGGVVVSQWD